MSKLFSQPLGRYFAFAFLVASIAIPAAAQVPRIDDEANSDQPILALDTGGHTNAVYKLMVSDYSRQLVSVGLDKTIRLWDLETGEPERVLRPPIAGGAHGYLFSAALAPDGKLLAVGTYRALTPLYDHRIHLIDIATGEMVRSLKGHSYTIYDLAFSPDGERLASASHDGTVRIWNVATGESLQTLSGHTAAVHAVSWSPDGKQVASGSLDKTARLWSLATGTATAVMREATDQIMTIGWRPDGKMIAVGCNDKTIRLYDTAGRMIYQWPRLPNEVTSLKFSPDSKRLLYTYGSNMMPPLGCAILDMTSGQQIAKFDGHDNSPICCVFTSDGQLAATGDSVSRIRVWKTASGELVRKLDGRGQSMMAAGWSPDGQAIAWGTHTGDATIDLGNRLERTFCLRTLAFGLPPDKTFVRPKPKLGTLQMGLNLAVQPVDLRKLYFLKDETLLNTFTLPQPYDQVRCYTLLTDERAVVGTNDGAYLYDIKTGLVQRHMTERGEGIWGVAPSPDFRYVLTAGNDQIMRVWRLDSGELLVALFVAGDEWIAWTPQGYYAASLAGESLMGWHLNRGPTAMSDFYPAAHFHKSLYRPDVIRRLLEAGDLSKAVELADKERQKSAPLIRVADVLPPEVKIDSPGQVQLEANESKLTIKATAAPSENQPLTDLQLIIDGRPYGAAKPVAAPAEGVGGPVEKQWEVELPPGEYSVAVKADSTHSYALTPPVEVTRKAEADAPGPKLRILAIGGPAEAAQAESVAKSLAAAAPKSFSGAEPTVLSGATATPAAIAAALEKIRGQATLADTTVIYFAGQEAATAEGQYQLSTAPGAAGTMSTEDLKRELAKIPGRLLVATDLTRSEQQMNRQAAANFCQDSASEEAARLDTAATEFYRSLLTADCGAVLLRASRRSGASSLPQALSEAVGGKADENKDGVVHLHELSRYVGQRVRELSGGKQTSVSEKPLGVRSFPLAQPPLVP